MKQKLKYPSGLEAGVWLHRHPTQMLHTHRHEDLEINLAVRGRATYLIKDQRYDMIAGTLLWLFPDQEHLLIEQSPDFQMWIMVWRRQSVRRLCRDYAPTLLARDPEGNFCLQLSEQTSRRLALLYSGLHQSMQDPRRLNAGAAYALLESFAASRDADRRAPLRRVHPAVEQAARLIYTESGDLTLASIAQQVGLSESRLSRLFRAQMGVTLVGYRQRRALERFLELLPARRGRKLMSVALEAGFGSYPQFHRIFCREMGMSPQEYLRDNPGP